MADMDVMQKIAYTIDLRSGLVQRPLHSQLMKGDKSANCVVVKITNGEEQVDLSGVAADGGFIRSPDAAEILLKGTADGDLVTVVLDDACYAQEGYCEINVRLTKNGTTRTILSLTGYVLSRGSGAVVDIGGVVPNIDDLLAMGAVVSDAANRAVAAAAAAQEAAQNLRITVMGQYDSEDMLRAAHPTGNPGEAYAVGMGEPYDVFIWDVNAADWKPMGKIDINGVGREKSFKALWRKVLAMSGGLFNLNKEQKRTFCQVTEHVVDPESTSVRESFRIRCGQTRTTIVLVTDGNASNLYRMPSINGKLFTLGSVYVSTGGSRTVTLKEINIDNKVYPDFEVLKTDGFRFKKLFLIYEQTGTYSGNAFGCVTTICITPDGFTVMETIDNDAAAGAIPDDFIKNSSGRVKEKAKHGNRLVFGYATDDEQLPPYDDTFVETIEDEGLTSFKRFSFGGVDWWQMRRF